MGGLLWALQKGRFMRWGWIAAVLVLAACASDNAATGGDAVSAKAGTDCAGVDWSSIGQRDGLYGEGAEKLAERAAECPQLVANTEDYERGRERGLKTYCTPDAGYDAGRNGRPYQGVCPADVEAPFLARYEAGKTLFDLHARVDSTKAALALAASTVESDRFELKRALERVSDIDSSAEQKSRAVADVDRYRQNIGRLEEEIPKLKNSIAEAEAALKNYRQ